MVQSGKGDGQEADKKHDADKGKKIPRLLPSPNTAYDPRP